MKEIIEKLSAARKALEKCQNDEHFSELQMTLEAVIAKLDALDLDVRNQALASGTREAKSAMD